MGKAVHQTKARRVNVNQEVVEQKISVLPRETLLTYQKVWSKKFWSCYLNGKYRNGFNHEEIFKVANLRLG